MNWLKNFFNSILNFFRSNETIARLLLMKALQNNPGKRARLKRYIPKARKYVEEGLDRMVPELIAGAINTADPIDRLIIREFISTLMPELTSAGQRIAAEKDRDEIIAALNKLDDIVTEVDRYGK